MISLRDSENSKYFSISIVRMNIKLLKRVKQEPASQLKVRDRFQEIINFVNIDAYDNACATGTKRSFYLNHIEPVLKTIILYDLYGEDWGNFLYGLNDEEIHELAKAMAGPIEMLKGRRVESIREETHTPELVAKSKRTEGPYKAELIVKPGTWEIYDLGSVRDGDLVIVDFGWPFSTRPPPTYAANKKPYAYVAKRVKLERPESEDDILNASLNELLGIKIYSKHLQLLFNSRKPIEYVETRYTISIERKPEEEKEEPEELAASDLR